MEFSENVVLSFKKVREEMEGIKSGAWNMFEEQNSLKKSVNDWIMFFVKENNLLRQRVEQLERRLSQPEALRRRIYA